MSFDLFYFWRYLLALVVGIYCLIVTGDRLRGYWRLLHGEERHWGFARKYLAIQLLRVDLCDVGWEITQIVLWLGVLGALVWAHRLLPTG